MAAVLGELDRILAVCKCFYEFYEEYKDVNSKFSGLYDDIVIVDGLVQSISGFYIPDNVKPCLVTVATNLEEILRKLKKYETESFFRKLIHVKTRKVYKLEDDLKDQISKIELLIKLKTIRENNSKTDVQRILGIHKEAHDYWVDNFGSDKIVVPFPVFIQSIQFTIHRRFRLIELNAFRLVLNCEDMVPAQAFLYWMIRFGSSVIVASNKMLNSLCDAENDNIFGWFHGEDFREISIQKLKCGGFGAALMRFSDKDVHIFVVHLNGFGKDKCEFQLEVSKDVDGYYMLRQPQHRNFSEKMIYWEIFEHSRKYIEDEKEDFSANSSATQQNENGNILIQADIYGKSNYYFRNLCVFMWGLQEVCKSLAEEFGVLYQPVNWQKGEIKDDYKFPSNWYLFVIGQEKTEMEKLEIYKKKQSAALIYEQWEMVRNSPNGIPPNILFRKFPKLNEYIRRKNRDVTIGDGLRKKVSFKGDIKDQEFEDSIFNICGGGRRK